MENKKKKTTATNATIAGMSNDTVQRYGSAINEHLIAYDGKDYENGVTHKRNLKNISKSKVDPNNKDANLKQQAGFSAEEKTVARENAERAVRGEKTRRSTRTDNMEKQSDGKGGSVGGTNDELYDIAETDANGNYIEGSGRQLKYVGKDANDCAKKLLAKDFDKYRDNDTPIEIPKDYYEDVIKELDKRAEDLERYIEDAEKKGNKELANKHREKLEKVKKTRKNLRKGKVTSKEAMEARTNAELSTAKDIGKLAHRSGIEVAKGAATFAGGISAIKNTVSVIKGEKDVDEAIVSVVSDTSSAAVTGYITGAAGGALKGCMQHAPSKCLQSLAKTNAPSYIVTAVMETGKTLKRYADGEINGTECLVELGEKGTGMAASSLGATIGTAILPGVGTVVGGFVGYALPTSYYNELVNTLIEAKLAKEERIRVEAECREAIEAIRAYRAELEAAINQYFADYIETFGTALAEINNAYLSGDSDAFIQSANAITIKLGGTPLFENQNEFDALMAKGHKFKL